MSDILVQDQTEPATPENGCSILWVDSATKSLKSKDSNGVVHNYSLADSSTIAICWNDAKCTTLNIAGTNAPSFQQFRDNGAGSVGLFVYKFGASSNDNIFGSIQLPHDYKQGTNIIPHVHWTTENANAGNITWELEYIWTNVSDTIPTTTTDFEVLGANSTAYKHNITSFSEINGTGKTISSIFRFRLTRNGTAASDTYGSNACLLDFDIHYQVDSSGSDEMLSKTN